MEKKMNKKVRSILAVLCVLGAFCWYATPASAVWYIEGAGMVIGMGSKVAKDKNNEEINTTTMLEKLNRKIIKGDGGESEKIYKDLAIGAMDAAADMAKGQYNAKDYIEKGLKDALDKELTMLTGEYNEWEKKMNDAIEAQEKEKLDKKQAIQKQMIVLQAQRDALFDLITKEPTEEREAQLIEIDRAIADLALQEKQISEKEVMDAKPVRKAKQKMSKLQKKIEEISAKYTDEKIQDMLQTETMKLFGMDTETDEKEIYETAISKLFLAEDEAETSQNIKRVMDERKREYYDAVKNALETVVTTQDSIERTNKHSRDCVDGSMGADSVFGAMGMKLCVEMQNAIVATGFLEVLLASLQLETTTELQRWDNKYRLNDYEKDITKFNLDDYMLEKEDLLSRAKEELKNRIKSGAEQQFQGFF